MGQLQGTQIKFIAQQPTVSTVNIWPVHSAQTIFFLT